MINRRHTFFLLLLGAMVVLGCGRGAPQHSPAQPPTRDPHPGGVADTPGADRYTTGPGEPTDSRHYAMLRDAGMFGHLDKHALVYDFRLEQAASVLVEVLEGGDEIDSLTIRHALWMSGVPETSAATASLAAPSRQNALDKVIAWLAEKSADGCNRMGLGVRSIPGGWQAVAIALPSLIAFDSFPRELSEPGAVEFDFQVAGGYSDVMVVMTAPDGRTVERPAVGDGESSATLELDETGIWQLEVLALSSAGPSPLAIFPVAVGTSHEVRLGGTRYDLDRREVAELERELYRYLGEARARLGLGPLELDDSLSDVARAYSLEMSETGEVAHISAISGDVADRVQRAGMRYPSLAENLGRGMSPHEVHLGLMSSPAHRGAILEPAAYRVGIGVALDRGDVSTSMLVTQIFALRAEQVDTEAAGREILDAIARTRSAVGLPELPTDEALVRGARSQSPVCFQDDFQMELDWEGSLYKSVISLIWKWPGGRQIAEDDVLPFQDPSFAALGVHVIQGDDPEMGAGTVCAVILVGVGR